MALDALIPEVWSARFLANLDKFLVYGNAINRDYQGDAEFGNIVKVPSLGGVTIEDYVKDTDHSTAETLTATTTDILINQQKMYNFQIDSIDDAQAKPSIMDQAMGRAAYAMADVVDNYIAEFTDSVGSKIGDITTPITPTVDDIYEYMTEAAQLLDSKNVPTYGRYIIMPPSGIKLLKDSGVFLSDTPTGDIVRMQGQFAAGALPNGYKGQVAGFDLWMSNNTSSDNASTSIWMAGHSMAISMVDSLNKVVAYNPERRFSEAIKGLYVFGAEVVAPDALVGIFTTLAG